MWRYLVILVVEPGTLVVAQHRHAPFKRRRYRNSRRALGIPVGNTTHLVGQMVPVTMLNCDLDRSLKAHRVLDVEHITGLISTRVPLIEGRTVAHERIRLHPPSVVKITGHKLRIFEDCQERYLSR